MEAKYEFGFIGTGHMGGALLRGIAQTVPADEIILSDGIPSKAQFFADELDCETGTNDDAAQAKYIVLGVKPQMLRDMLKGIYPTLSARQDRYVLISMAAGVSMDTIRSMLGLDCPVIRIMPNTAAEVGQAVIMLAHDSRVQTDEAEYVKKVQIGRASCRERV